MSGLHRPAALFVQVWLRWSWLPLLTRSKAGVTLSWGPLMAGYIRGDEREATDA